MNGKLLVLLTGADQITTEMGSYPGGLNLFSLIEALDPLLKAGWKVSFSSPDGRTPTTQPHCFHFLSEVDKAFYEAYLEDNPNFLMPVSLSDMTEEKLQPFAGLLIPDGLGYREDYPLNPEAKRVLAHFHHYHKPIAAIGHGVSALLHSDYQENWCFAGYAMTTLSAETEARLERWTLDDAFPYSLPVRLEAAGARLTYGRAGKPYCVEDRELITAHNPYSALDLGVQFKQKLEEWLRTV